MPDFVAVKEIVSNKQTPTDAQELPWSSVVHIQRLWLQLQALLGKMYLNHAHGPVEA